METVSEYIPRSTILEYLEESKPQLEDWRKDNGEGLSLQEIRYLAADNMYCELKELLENPRIVVDASPDVHGHWQELQTVRGYTYECSICKGHITYDEHGEEVFSDFCPYCSAILDEEVNEEDTGVKNEYLKLSPKKAESEGI